MITDFTHNALNSSLIAMFLNEIYLGKCSPEGFTSLRDEAQTLVEGIPALRGITLPLAFERAPDPDPFDQILDALMKERSMPGGEVLPLTLFALSYSASRGVLFAALGNEEEWRLHRTIMGACLKDLGIEKDEVARFERGAKGLVVKGPEGDDFVRNQDRVEFVSQTLKDYWERTLRAFEELDVSEQLGALRAQMDAFQCEVRTQHVEVIERLDALRDQLRERLVAGGVPRETAAELSDTSSPTFAQRLGRWITSDKARDAAEAALWAALDFVPLGGVAKLGFKIAEAVRGATKEKRG